MTMPLPSEILNQIKTLVRGGFETRDRIVEILCEELYEPGELEETEVTAGVDEAFARLDAEKKTWPATTDCDKLDEVFSALNAKGIIALQNAGYTQSDGYDDILDAYDRHPEKHKLVGYCFYQGQDLERAVNGKGLLLAFGPIDPKKEESEGPVIGGIIVEELHRVGFSTEWNGSFSQRISIPQIDWKRR